MCNRYLICRGSVGIQQNIICKIFSGALKYRYLMEVSDHQQPLYNIFPEQRGYNFVVHY